MSGLSASGYHVALTMQYTESTRGLGQEGGGSYWKSTKDHGKQVQRPRGVADPGQFQVRHLRG